MAVIQRPAKQGNATTYQGKVAQGYTGILAAEVDADLDTIYAAWNGGVDTVNIAAGSITADKIAPNQIGTRELADLGVATGDLANLAVTTPKLADLAVTTAKLADGAVTAAKLNAAAGGDLSGTLPNPAVAKINSGGLYVVPRGLVSTPTDAFDLYANSNGSPGYNASQPTWIARLRYANDTWELWRAPAGTTNWVSLFTVNNAGNAKFRAMGGGMTRSAGQAIGSGVTDIVQYDTVWIDSSGGTIPHTVGSYLLTPYLGWYVICANVIVDGQGGLGLGVNLEYDNGTNGANWYNIGTRFGQQETNYTLCTMRTLAANWRIRCTVANGTGAARAVQAGSNITIFAEGIT